MTIKRKEVSEIKETAGEFFKEALEARKEYLELRLKQDAEIRKIYVRSADRVAEEIRQGGHATLREKQLRGIEAQLRKEAERLNGELTQKIGEHIGKGAAAGTGHSKSVLIGMLDKAGDIPEVTTKITKSGVGQMYFRVNKQAVEAVWERTHKGLKLSDRIWNTSQETSQVMANIIQDAVARGQDAVTTARMLEQYVRKGANELAKHYEGMVDRMKGRVPGDISYPALRLARTETTAAFGQGTIKAAQASPATIGIKYCLSAAHVIIDICDVLAAEDQGLGAGVYPVNNPPFYPAHPNTLSYLVTVSKNIKEFVQELKQWVNDPSSQPQINGWYENVYKPEVGRGIMKSGTTKAVKPVASAASPDPLLAAAVDKFQPAKTIKEAERFALENNLADVADYSGVLLEVANEWNQAIHDTLEQFPELRENIQFVGTIQARNEYDLAEVQHVTGHGEPQDPGCFNHRPQGGRF